LLRPPDEAVVNPEISPDGRLVAYAVVKDDRPVLFISAFPDGRGQWPVSNAPASPVRWTSARELVFAEVGQGNPLSRMKVVTLQVSDQGVTAGTPRPLFAKTEVADATARVVAISGGGGRWIGVRAMSDAPDDAGRVVVVQNWLAEFTRFTVYGTTGQVRATIEGLNATEHTGAFGNYPDVGAMEEIVMNTAAHSSEASTPGVQTQFISKSGGNEFRGTFYGGYSPERWQSFNIDQDQINRGLTGGGGLAPEDVNRLSSYQDENVGLGGYVKKDKFWWYFSSPPGHQGAFRELPGEAQTTILNNFSVKATYNLSTNNKLVAYTQPSQKEQPQRFDSFLLGVDTGINTSEATTWNQNFWAWVHKLEWNGVLSDNGFAEIRGGQYGYDWTNGVNGTGLHYEDIGNNLIYGRNRNWARERRRNQVLGSVSQFVNGWGGDHSFKLGGEVFYETVTDIYKDGYKKTSFT
jgi:hypothetical protein